MTTMQDLGRPGYAHLGVSAAGAADAVSLRLANLLVGNLETAPALEMTLKGGRFAFDDEAVVALVGGDFACSISMGRAVLMKAGDVLEVGECRAGARCYLAVRGGFAAKYDLGSASTHLLGGLGQVVRRGDVLGVGLVASRSPSDRFVTKRVLQDFVRITMGSDTESFSGLHVLDLLSQEWVVSEHSNRQGLRLLGGKVGSPAAGLMDSEGVALGAIQIPPGGEPVILFVDSQTTGGYPVIANVASVDLGLVGQLRPGAKFWFRAVSFGEARRLLLEQEAWIRGAV